MESCDTFIAYCFVPLEQFLVGSRAPRRGGMLDGMELLD